jgi:hypothetical protein
MPAHVCPVLIEMGTERYAAGINAPSKAEPVPSWGWLELKAA